MGDFVLGTAQVNRCKDDMSLYVIYGIEKVIIAFLFLREKKTESNLI